MMPTFTEEELENLMAANPDLAAKNGRMKKVKPAPAISPDAPEADFQAKLIRELKDNGWMVHAERTALSKSGKFMTPIQGDKGFFDIVAIHPERELVLLVECKSDGGTLSKFQEKWFLAASKCSGILVRVVRPENWQEIMTIITIEKEE
jgi:hypothetical protein